MNEELILKEVFGSMEPEVTEQSEEVDTEALEEVADETIEDATEQETEETDGQESETQEEGEAEENEESEEKEEEKKGEEEKEPEKDDAADDELVMYVKELDPDSDVKDHASAMEFIKERVKESDETIQLYEKNNKEIYDIFNNTPEVADFMKALIKGMDPKVAAGIYISESLAPEDGDEGIEQYQDALKERKAEQKKREDALEEFQSNQKESAKVAESFVIENKIDRGEFEKYLETFDEQIIRLKSGKLSKDLLSFVWKANKYDKDIKSAEEKGYLRGKNEKIVLKKNSKENTDGLPNISSGNEKERESPKESFWDRVARGR